MTHLHEDIIAKLQGLSHEDLQKVLQFVETLSAPNRPIPQRKSLRGLFAHRGIDITAEPRKADRVPYDGFVVTLRWRDKFGWPQSTRFVEYTEDVDASTLVIWLRERLGVRHSAQLAG